MSGVARVTAALSTVAGGGCMCSVYVPSLHCCPAVVMLSQVAYIKFEDAAGVEAALQGTVTIGTNTVSFCIEITGCFTWMCLSASLCTSFAMCFSRIKGMSGRTRVFWGHTHFPTDVIQLVAA